MADCPHPQRRWFGGLLLCEDCGHTLDVARTRPDPDPMPRVRLFHPEDYILTLALVLPMYAVDAWLIVRYLRRR